MRIFPGVEKEVVDLAIEARAFLHHSMGGKDLRAVHLKFVVSERIHWVVAWVMYQKAIFAGEITSAEAMEYIGEMAERTIADDPAMGEEIDPHLRSLVERSGRLFSRIQRLVMPVPASIEGQQFEDRV